jgi:hypothetical protein
MREEEEKVPAIDGKVYTKDQLFRMNFLFIGGEFHGSEAKTINGIEIKDLSLTEVLNIGKKEDEIR